MLPEKASFKVESLSELSPELVDQLLEHFVDPVHGSPSKGRKTVGVMSLHVDDLIISGAPEFLTWFLKKIREHFTVGHEDKNDLTFTGQRVRWVLDAQGQKKYISIDQKLCVSELEEIVIPKHLKDADVCDKAQHLPIVPCLVASIGFSRELNFKHVISSLAWPLHPQHQPSVTVRS